MSDRIRIWVDAMWAEQWVDAVIEAVKNVLNSNPDVQFVIYWTKELLLWISENSRVSIVESKNDIQMDIKSYKSSTLKRQDSSMRLGLDDVSSKNTNALISNGHTGALVAGTAFDQVLWRLTNDNFMALAAILPQRNGGNTLYLDVWADDRWTDKLTSLQNAIMAYEYVTSVWWIKKPVIGYASIWTEEWKWKNQDKESFDMIAEYFWDDVKLERIEPNNFLNSWCDIIITSWIRGNMNLKMWEWVFWEMKHALSLALKDNPGWILKKMRWKLAWWIWWDLIKEQLLKYDPNSRWWALILGVNWIVVKSHGWAGEEAITSAILQAIEFAKAQEEHDILWKTKSALDALQANLSDTTG